MSASEPSPLPHLERNLGDDDGLCERSCRVLADHRHATGGRDQCDRGALQRAQRRCGRLPAHFLYLPPGRGLHDRSFHLVAESGLVVGWSDAQPDGRRRDV